MAMEHRPQCVVIDASIGTEEARMIATFFKSKGRDNNTRVVGLVSDDEVTDPNTALYYDETFRRPFDPALLAVRVKSLSERLPA
jgi:DNA-binding response OmpR family regulator